MTLEDQLRARIDTLCGNMERYADRTTDKHARALLLALLVILMKPSIKAHLLRYDPMALKQAMDAIEAGEPVLVPVIPVPKPPQPYRTHECACGNKWDALVRYGATANISGELTCWCPLCGKKPMYSTPHHFNGEQT